MPFRCRVLSFALVGAWSFVWLASCVGDDPILDERPTTDGSAQTEMTSPPPNVVVNDARSDACPQPRSSIGVFRPRTREFFLRRRVDADVIYPPPSVLDVPDSAARPLVGDWNGDGQSGIAVFDPIHKKIYLRNSLSPGKADEVRPIAPPSNAGECFTFAGRFRACAADDVAICCVDGNDGGNDGGMSPSFQCRLGTGDDPIEISYGIAGDRIVFGDWNGDGVETIGVYRPSDRSFHLRNTNDTGFAEVVFPFPLDAGPEAVPVAMDLGEGRSAVGLYQRGFFFFYSTTTDAGATFHFGDPDDEPLTGFFMTE